MKIPTFSNKVYDALKWLVIVLIPAMSVLYVTMAKIWNLPYSSEVVGTLAALDTFLGVLLGLSSLQYKRANPDLNLTTLPITVAWILNDATYNTLKWIVQIALPAAATLYFTLAGLWHFPNPDQVVATIMAITTFLGMILQFSTSQFNKIAVMFHFRE